jgi:hypothetical protein
MNRRKLAHKMGLTALRSKTAKKQALLTRKVRNICAIRPSLYNAGGMPDLNQIIHGDSTRSSTRTRPRTRPAASSPTTSRRRTA